MQMSQTPVATVRLFKAAEDRRIAIMTPYPFPIGNVATNRFTTYAKALSAADCDVEIIVLKATEIDGAVLNPALAGVHEGVRYRYMASSTLWNPRDLLIVKAYLYGQGIWLALKYLICAKPSAVILYTEDLVYMFIFGLASRALKIRIFVDKSEYPRFNYKKRLAYRLAYNFALKLFNGFIVMTRELDGFYRTLKRRDATTFLLPMTVDMSRFSNGQRSVIVDQRYVGCVFGTHNRDCILDTIRSFDEFCRSTVEADWLLMLVGDFANLLGREEVLICLDACQSKSRIHFLPSMTAMEMPSFLLNATCLITTPRYFVSGGFPTKLGEYLATGKPVVTTAAGEIPMYLENRVNCLLATPGNVEEIASQLAFVYQSPSVATEIGKRGQAIAASKFSASAYVQGLINFLI